MKELLFALKSGFGWLSTIPVGISMDGVEALMKHVYVFPVVGLVLGGILGVTAYIATNALPANLVAILAIVAIYKLCGINHIDGLADFGDGVIAHGTQEKKVQAMKDVNLGLLAAEVSAKEAMISFAAFSTSLQKGFGQIMIEKTGYKQFLIGLAISAIICAAVLGPLGLAVLAGAQVAALYMVNVAKRNFGGATGDGIGATNEVARCVALALALILGGILPWTLW